MGNPTYAEIVEVLTTTLPTNFANLSRYRARRWDELVEAVEQIELKYAETKRTTHNNDIIEIKTILEQLKIWIQKLENELAVIESSKPGGKSTDFDEQKSLKVRQINKAKEISLLVLTGILIYHQLAVDNDYEAYSQSTLGWLASALSKPVKETKPENSYFYKLLREVLKISKSNPLDIFTIQSSLKALSRYLNEQQHQDSTIFDQMKQKLRALVETYQFKVAVYPREINHTKEHLDQVIHSLSTYITSWSQTSLDICNKFTPQVEANAKDESNKIFLDFLKETYPKEPIHHGLPDKFKLSIHHTASRDGCSVVISYTKNGQAANNYLNDYINSVIKQRCMSALYAESYLILEELHAVEDDFYVGKYRGCLAQALEDKLPDNLCPKNLFVYEKDRLKEYKSWLYLPKFLTEDMKLWSSDERKQKVLGRLADIGNQEGRIHFGLYKPKGGGAIHARAAAQMTL